MNDFNYELVQGNIKQAMAEAGAKSSDLWKIDPRKLVVLKGLNYRDKSPTYREHVRWLKGQILAHGFDEAKPITVVVMKNEAGDPVPVVFDGHTRHTAVMELINDKAWDGVVTVVTKNKRDLTKSELTTMQLAANKGLAASVNETATAYARMLADGMSVKEIAQADGVSRTYVDDLLVLAKADPKVRELVYLDRVSATLAIVELKKDPDGALQRLLDGIAKAEAKGKTKATAKHLKDDDGDGEGGSGTKPKKPKIARSAEDIMLAIKTNGDCEYTDALKWVMGIEDGDSGDDAGDNE